MIDLTVIIPTRDRRAVLHETIARLEEQASEVEFEAIVVDDGSTDDTVETVEALAGELSFDLALIRHAGQGAAAARNSALAIARAPVCLFLDDDTWPRPGALARHRDFHRRHPEPHAAMLGFVDIAPSPAPTPFMRWLAGLHLGYDRIADPANAGGQHFFSGHVSAKTELLRGAGGFDEGYPAAGVEDIDLGLRLEEQGMRLVYDAHAVVDHFHPTDLPRTIQRMRRGGASLEPFGRRHPRQPMPSPPGFRHRAKGAALTALALTRVRTTRVQQETWRFLCHMATREGYWDAVAAREGRRTAPQEGLRVGRTLARLASRDEDARMPRTGLPPRMARGEDQQSVTAP